MSEMEFRVGRADRIDQEKDALVSSAEEHELDVRKKVSVSQIDTETHLYFLLQVANKGSEPVHHIVIDNPIPERTSYIEDSAAGDASLVQFSMDGGGSWARANELLEEVVDSSHKRTLRKADSDSYTHVRWLIDTIEPGSVEDLSFKVRVIHS